MFSLIILILLVALFYFWLGRIWRKKIDLLGADLDSAKGEQGRLLEENSVLKSEITALQNSLEQTIAIYNLTKQICMSLEEEKVFANFSAQINRYVALVDLKFIKVDADMSPYGNYTVLPLAISHKTIGYLVADGVNDKEKDKFNILAHQFMLGMKRVLLYQKVQEMAITDGLTGVFTRRHYLERFHEELARSKKFKYNSSVLMVDIDNFKTYNDKYGHLVGDAILKEVSRTIKDNIRQVDAIGRYGGEEFVIVLTETDKNGARFAAERIRQAIEDKQVRAYDEDLKITISIGVSTFPDDAPDAANLIDKADMSLYRAKQAGRNRVCVHGIYR